jgi:hypothetical protein
VRGHVCDGGLVGAFVDGGGLAVEGEQVFGAGPADHRGHVELGGEGDRVEDADDGEPVAAELDVDAAVGSRDAEQVGGAGADHDGGEVCQGGSSVRYGDALAGQVRIWWPNRANSSLPG